MSETMKVFLACAIGAFVGTLVALELNQYFWWVGLLAGGLTGYISYEFKKVVTAIPTAWRKAHGWQPNREWWREVRALFGLSNTVMIAFLPVATVTGLIPWLSLYVLGTVYLTLLILSFIGTKTEDIKREKQKLQVATNPLRFYFWFLPRWVLKEGWRLLRGTPAFIAALPRVLAQSIVVTAKFATYLFREIHSDIRMLCGMDAAIGAAVGYFAGSVLIGALAGGFWGALNFEILSIRILKLVPIEKSLFR